VSETKAYGPEIHNLHNESKINAARLDRIDQNIELLMRSQHLKPLPKSDTESQLENRNITYSPEDGENQ
jgi:hypothetical protein